MKTMLIISDTHGNRAAMEQLATVCAESDYIIHLGDTSGDGNLLFKQYPHKTYLLNGNCDLIKIGDNELTLQVEDVTFFLCHGDKYGVKSQLYRLSEKAKEVGASVALYGHTHNADCRDVNGVLCINPGTLSRYAQKSYCYLVVNGSQVVEKIVAINS